MRIFTITIFTFFSVLNGVFAQSPFEPQSISTNINSEYDELNPILSPDGKTLYFLRVNHPENYYGEEGSQDVWFSTLQEDGTWSTPARLNALFNLSRNNAILAITKDGKSMLVAGQYTSKNHIWKKRGLSTVSVLENDTSFSPPVPVKIPKYHRINKGSSSNTYFDNDESVLLMSFTKKWKKENLDLYISTKKENGKWKAPKKVSKNINKEFKSVNAPFLSSDGETLYFAGYKKGKENKNKYDIYKCTKTDGTYRNWSNPEKVSDTVNSAVWESYFKTNEDGSWATFATTRDPKNKSDIYIVKLFEDNPYIKISGVVINSFNDTTFNKEFEITVNGEKPDSIIVDEETSSYSIIVPYGEKYEIEATAENYKTSPIEVDASKITEYTEIEQSLALAPIPYVLVRGKYVDKKTGAAIPATSSPKLAINDQIIDTLSSDDPGSYQIKLPWGKSYSFQVVADQYVPEKMRLDLTLTETYKEMDLDLMAAPFAKFAVVKGKVINKKSGNPLTGDFAVNVDDEKSISTKLTPGTGEYYLELPLGKEYTLNASSDGFFPVYETVDLSQNTENITITKDLVLSPLAKGEHIRINNIFFEQSSSVLKPESFHDLAKVAELLKKYDHMKIEIGGHTDSWGGYELNRKLSEERAKAVREYIISLGIPEDRVAFKGYGESTPVATNKTKAGRAQNRRVEFTILEE